MRMTEATCGNYRRLQLISSRCPISRAVGSARTNTSASPRTQVQVYKIRTGPLVLDIVPLSGPGPTMSRIGYLLSYGKTLDRGVDCAVSCEDCVKVVRLLSVLEAHMHPTRQKHNGLGGGVFWHQRSSE
jgi:hypothetical protein